jgi:hypothetical protein
LGISRYEGQKLIQRRSFERQKQVAGRPIELSPYDEVILFFLHFRHYPTDILLASIFHIPKSTASRTHHRMRKWLFQLLQPELTWHDFTWRWNHGGCDFHGQMFTFLVDGSEQRVTSSDNVRQNLAHYSSKKGQPSLNIVAWVAMSGQILHLSHTYGGGTNDNDILKKEKDVDDGWMKQLEPQESGFGDSGFDALEHLKVYSVPSERNSMYSRIAHYRITAEQSFEKIKNFGSCSDPLRFAIATNPDKVKEYHQQCWTIAAVLVNRRLQE